MCSELENKPVPFTKVLEGSKVLYLLPLGLEWLERVLKEEDAYDRSLGRGYGRVCTTGA